MISRGPRQHSHGGNGVYGIHRKQRNGVPRFCFQLYIACFFSCQGQPGNNPDDSMGSCLATPSRWQFRPGDLQLVLAGRPFVPRLVISQTNHENTRGTQEGAGRTAKEIPKSSPPVSLETEGYENPHRVVLLYKSRTRGLSRAEGLRVGIWGGVLSPLRSIPLNHWAQEVVSDSEGLVMGMAGTTAYIGCVAHVRYTSLPREKPNAMPPFCSAPSRLPQPTPSPRPAKRQRRRHTDPHPGSSRPATLTRSMPKQGTVMPLAPRSKSLSAQASSRPPSPPLEEEITTYLPLSAMGADSNHHGRLWGAYMSATLNLFHQEQGVP